MVKLKVAILLLVYHNVLSESIEKRPAFKAPLIKLNNTKATERIKTDTDLKNAASLKDKSHSIVENSKVTKYNQELFFTHYTNKAKIPSLKKQVKNLSRRNKIENKSLQLREKKQGCHNIKCPMVENPVCVKLVYTNSAKVAKLMFIIVLNKCEMNYAKCQKGVVAKIVPMKYCQHEDLIAPKKAGTAKRRSKRDISDNPEPTNSKIDRETTPLKVQNSSDGDLKKSIARQDDEHPGDMHNGDMFATPMFGQPDKEIETLNQKLESTGEDSENGGNSRNKGVVLNQKDESTEGQALAGSGESGGGAEKVNDGKMFPEPMFGKPSDQGKMLGDKMFQKPMFEHSVFGQSDRDVVEKDFDRNPSEGEKDYSKSDDGISGSDDDVSGSDDEDDYGDEEKVKMLDDKMFEESMFGNSDTGQSDTERGKMLDDKMFEESMFGNSDTGQSDTVMVSEDESEPREALYLSEGNDSSPNEEGSSDRGYEQTDVEKLHNDHMFGKPMFSDSMMIDRDPMKNEDLSDEDQVVSDGSSTIEVGSNADSSVQYSDVGDGDNIGNGGGGGGDMHEDNMFGKPMFEENSLDQGGKFFNKPMFDKPMFGASNEMDVVKHAQYVDSAGDYNNFSSDVSDDGDKLAVNNAANKESNEIKPTRYEEKVDYDEYTASCPSVCPARDVSVCTRCSHGVYRTFPSVCHVRMFHCAHASEKLELISRRPCMMSAPYFSSDLNMETKGRVTEPDDHDVVLRFILCRDKGKLGKDPKCNFDDKKALTEKSHLHAPEALGDGKTDDVKALNDNLHDTIVDKSNTEENESQEAHKLNDDGVDTQEKLNHEASDQTKEKLQGSQETKEKLQGSDQETKQKLQGDQEDAVKLNMEASEEKLQEDLEDTVKLNIEASKEKLQGNQEDAIKLNLLASKEKLQGDPEDAVKLNMEASIAKLQGVESDEEEGKMNLNQPVENEHGSNELRQLRLVDTDKNNETEPKHSSEHSVETTEATQNKSASDNRSLNLKASNEVTNEITGNQTEEINNTVESKEKGIERNIKLNGTVAISKSKEKFAINANQTIDEDRDNIEVSIYKFIKPDDDETSELSDPNKSNEESEKELEQADDDKEKVNKQSEFEVKKSNQNELNTAKDQEDSEKDDISE